jgi:hypothetical protein
MNSDYIIAFGKALGIAILLLVVASIIILGLIGIIQAVFGLNEQEKAEMRVPRLISESDGCKVYKFVDDGTHYFTRCGEQVSTVRHYTESCGKNCTRNRTEEIATEGNK